MTVAELLDELNNAIGRGLSPDTTVVLFDDASGWYRILDEVDDPSAHPEGEGSDMWFTLFPGEEADPRFTPGGPPAPLNPEWHAIVTAAQIRADNERRA